jgi:hypothetical protein
MELVAKGGELVVCSGVQDPKRNVGRPPSAVQPRKRRKKFFHETRLLCLSPIPVDFTISRIAARSASAPQSPPS